MKPSILTLILLAGLGAPTLARADFVIEDVGGGLARINIDNNLNFTGTTILSDVNYVVTSGYWDSVIPNPLGIRRRGHLSLSEANAWADQLVYGGFDDWRLVGADTCLGICVAGGSEVSAIFVGLAGMANRSIIIEHNSVYDSFLNFERTDSAGTEPDLIFWTGNLARPFPGSALTPLVYNFDGGTQGFASTSELHFAIVVRGSILDSTYNGVINGGFGPGNAPGFIIDNDDRIRGPNGEDLGPGAFFQDGVLVTVPVPPALYLLMAGFATLRLTIRNGSGPLAPRLCGRKG